MAVNLSPVGGVAVQFFTNDGAVLSGGKIYTYAAGTNTPQATYTTSAGNIAHTNPIILNSAGRVPTGEIWLTDGLTYKFVINDSSDVLIGTYDNVTNITNASQITYDPAGASAVATTVQTKLRETVSVKDFGAVGNGVADDTAAIQAALNSGATAVYVPSGTYKITTVTVTSQKLFGFGTVVKAASARNGVILAGTNATLDGLTFNGIAYTGTGRSGFEVKFANGAVTPEIRNCIFSTANSVYDAVIAADDPDDVAPENDYPYAVNVNGAKITNCKFTGNYARPINLLCLDNTAITNSYFSGCRFDAIRTRETTGSMLISDNIFENIGDPTWPDTQTRDAIDTAFSGDKLIISNNIVNRTSFSGFDIKGVDSSGVTDGYSSRQIIVTGNHIERTRFHGIAIGNTASSYIIANNIVTRCNQSNLTGTGSVGDAAIYVSGLVKNLSIHSNHCLYNYGRGIFVTPVSGATTNASIKDNICINNSDRGISIADIDAGFVSGNMCADDSNLANSGAQLYGLSLTGTATYTNRLIVNNNICKNNVNGQILFEGSGTYQNALFSFDHNYEEGAAAYSTGTGFARWQAKQPRIYWGTGTLPASTAGTFNVGDIIYYEAPTAGGNIGQVCITAGTPGTWKTFGAIAA
jgi:hypothetical protein